MKRQRVIESSLNPEETCTLQGKRTAQRRRRRRKRRQTSLKPLQGLLFFCSMTSAYSSDFDCEKIRQWSDGRKILKPSDYASGISGIIRGEFDFDDLQSHWQLLYVRWADTPCSEYDFSYSERCIDTLSQATLQSLCRDIGSTLDATNVQPKVPRIPSGAPTKTPSIVKVPSSLPTKFPSTMIGESSWQANLALTDGISSEHVEWHRNLQTLQQCFIFISIGDTNRNNLLTQSEYVTFLNRLSDNRFAGLQFSEIPLRFRTFFDEVSGEGGIDVSGSKPGQTPSPTEAQFLDSFCEDSKELLSVTDPPAQQPAGPPTASCDDSISRQQCYIDMSIADRNRDSFIIESEYVRLVNRLSDNEYEGAAFDELPAAIRGNFFNLASDGGIDVDGSKPGQSPDENQAVFLLRVCCETDLSIRNPNAPTVSPPPGSEPTANPGGFNCDEAVSRQKCNIFLSIADLSKDNFLNEVEYIRFLDRLSGTGAYDDVAFGDLSAALAANYNKFATVDDQIDIFGTKPGQSASPSQDESVDAFCCETDLLVKGITQAPFSSPPTGPAMTPTAQPSPSPSVQSDPTIVPMEGELEVFNAFIIINIVGISAGQLGSGANRNGLNRAYDTFVKEAVNRISQNTASSSLRRQRRMEVSFVTESPEIYRLRDTECPDRQNPTNRDVCQIVYAKFLVDIQDENTIQVVDQYIEATQNDIESGFLQDALSSEDPFSPLKILNATFPVRDETPTSSPTSVPISTDPPAPPDEEDSSNAGAIVGGLFGTLFICVFFVFVGWYSKKRDKRKKGKNPGNEDEENSIGDGEGKVAGNIVGPSSSQELSFNNFFENIKNRFGGLSKGKVGDPETGDGEEKDDDDSDHDDNAFGGFGANTSNAFGEPDGKPGKKEKKNKFGFGKKSKQEEQPDAFGLETVFSDQDSKQAEGFGNYDFEDPTSGDEEDDDDEEAGSKEDLFESNMSPAWGTSATGFGSNWGAGGSNDLESDILMSKTFATDVVHPEGKADEEGESNDDDSESGSSYETSEDGTYETSADERQRPSDSFSESSNHEMEDDSSADNSAAEEELVRDNWQEPQQATNSLGEENDENDETSDQEDSYDESSQTDSEGLTSSTATSNSEERAKRAEYRAKVGALVRLVLPDEANKVDEMMDQFKGREAELVSTLQNMQERSATQRARAAVHKSKTRPTREETRAGGSYAGAGNIVGGASEGSAAGTAAIAAASLPIPTGGFDESVPPTDTSGDDGDRGGFGNDNAFGPGEDGSFYSDDRSGDGEASYYSDDRGDSFRSGDDQSYQEGSYYSGEDDGESRSYDDRSGESRSFTEESGTGGSYSNEGQSEGSYSDSFDEEDQSFADESGSYRSQEEDEEEVDFEDGSFGEEEVEDGDGGDDDGSEEVVSLSQEKDSSFQWN
eukprot:scaffold1034_cov127-Cylindrotheca_fusiformis.AAC.10